MKFKKYPSLTNHYAIAKAGQFNLNQEYVSTEKIHGANISIVIDNLRESWRSGYYVL